MRLARWLLALVLLAGCASLPGHVEPLSVTLADVRPTQIGLLEQEYMMRLRVQNPNNADIALAGVSFSVDLNGKEFAKGVSRLDTIVPAFGDVVLDVKAISSLGNVLDQVNTLRQATPERITYRLQGRLSPARDLAVLPFDSTGAIDLAGLTGERPK